MFPSTVALTTPPMVVHRAAMAPPELGNSDEISIYAEFITSLSVANIFVGFQSAPGGLRVRRVSVERRNISVALAEARPDSGSGCPEPAPPLTLSVALPSFVALLPNTCSSLQPSPFGWQLRMNVEEIAEDGLPQAEGPQGPFVPRCRACKSSILRAGASISTILPLKALGLAPGMDWDRVGFSYFCHDHEHEEESHHKQEDEEPPVNQKALFAPQPGEMFVGDVANVLSAEALDPTRLIVAEGGSVACGRCHAVLGWGYPKCGAVKLYVDAVLGAADDDLAKVLGNFVKGCSHKHRRVRASLQDSEDTLLLWIMDRNLKIFQARVAKKSQRQVQRDVCKILYKHEKLDSPLCTQWANDSAVKQVAVHESLLAHLLSALLSSTESLPMAWRYANDFCVGYLNI